jgi:hypothetical protein
MTTTGEHIAELGPVAVQTVIRAIVVVRGIGALVKNLIARVNRAGDPVDARCRAVLTHVAYTRLGAVAVRPVIAVLVNVARKRESNVHKRSEQ